MARSHRNHIRTMGTTISTNRPTGVVECAEDEDWREEETKGKEMAERWP